MQTELKPITKNNLLKEPTKWEAIKSFLKENPYSYLAFAFLVPVFLMYLIYLAMEVHPFGDGCVLVLDLNAQYVYFYEALRKAIYGDNSLIYSFQRALGGEFMGIYAYYIASPFSYLVALFPEDRMLEALLFIFLLKSGICGTTFGWYLHKKTKPECRNKIAIVTFLVLYAMSSYCVVQQNNSMWIDAVMWLPVLTYSIEQLVKFGKYRLFVVMLALTLISNYYIGYMVCIYVAAYFFFYYFKSNEKSETSQYFLNNPLNEKKHFMRSFVRIALYSALAIGIAAVIVFTAYYSLTFGKTTFSNPSWALSMKFEIMDFLTKFLPGSYDTVRPEGLPFVYCGLLTVILLPVFFCAKKISAREKIASGIFMLFFFLSFICSTVDLIWHGFQRPNWLNYRYSFMLCFFLLVLAYKGFGELRRVSGKVILSTCLSVMAFVTIAQQMTFDSYVKNNGKLITLEVIVCSLIAAAAYLVVLALARTTKQKESVCLILAIVCVVEVYCSGLTNVVQFGKDVVYSKYSNYNNYLSEIRPITYAVQDSDHSFYRMEKTTSRKANDEMALGMNGLSCSTSTLNRDTIDFLRYMGYASKSNWSRYFGGSPVSDGFFGIKYLLSKDEALPPIYENYPVDLEESSSYKAYYNPYALSLAFAASANVDTLEFSNTEKYDTPMERLNDLITACLGEEETLELFKTISVNKFSTNSNCDAAPHGLYYKYSPIDPEKDATLTYTVIVPENTAPIEENDGIQSEHAGKVEVYFYLAADNYPREVSLKVNHQSKGSFGGNDTYRIVSLGYYEPGTELTVEATIKNDSKNLYVKKNSNCFYYIDYQTYTDAFTRLKSGAQYIIDDNCKDDHLTGKMTTTEANQNILTTIPYDEGWQILVDGLQVEYRETLDSVITFEIENAGEHTVEMIYRPSALVTGLMISCASIVLFCLVCIFEKKIRVMMWGKRVLDESGIDLHADEWENDFMLDALPVTSRLETPAEAPSEASTEAPAEVTETEAQSSSEMPAEAPEATENPAESTDSASL